MNDFYYNQAEAHGTIDRGGDIIFATRYTLANSSSWISPVWSFPIRDIIEVYSRMGHSVSAAKLRSCAIRGLAILKAELSLAPRLYDSYAEKSPTMITEIDGYYLGGVQEMASSAAYCWVNLTRWYAHGTPQGEGGEWEICDTFKALGRKRGAQKNGTFLSPTKHSPIWDYDVQAKQALVNLSSRNKFGVETYSLNDGTQNTPRPREHHRASSNMVVPQFAPDPTYISTYYPYSQFGHALAVGAIGPVPDDLSLHIAITAPLETEYSYHPNAGSVFILGLSQLERSSPQLTELTKLKSPILQQDISESPTSNTRFGQAIAVWSPFLPHRHSLLAISSPGPQIFNPTLPLNQHPAGKIDIFSRGVKVQTWYGLGAALGGRGIKWWGEVLVSGILSDGLGEDLVIGSPMSDGEEPPPEQCPRSFFYAQRGFVQVARYGEWHRPPKRPQRRVGPQVRIENHINGDSTLPEPIIWTIYPPPMPTGQDPCAMLPPLRFGSALAITPKSRLLLVGAPGMNVIYAYRFEDSPDLERLFTISVPEGVKGKRVDFGSSIVTSSSWDGREWVAIASPGENGGRGIVRIYVLETEGRHKPEPTLVAEVCDEEKEDHFSRFGRVMQIDSARDGLWVGSGYAAGERGAVWWVNVHGILTKWWSLPTREGQEAAAQVILGPQRRVIKVNSRRVLVGPEEQKTHFGEAMWAADVNSDGIPDLVVGMPLAGTKLRDGSEKPLTGAVVLYIGING